MTSNKMYKENTVVRRRALPGRRRTPAPTTPSVGGSHREGVPREDTYFTAVLMAIQWFITIFPVLFIYGTVVPLLTETVPFLASRCPVPIDLTPLLQLVFMGFLAALTKQYYGLQLPSSWRGLRHEGDAWCSRCSRLVARDATHCRVCSQCIQGRKFHWILLNVCVGRTNMSACQSLLLRMTAGSLAALALLLLEAALGHAPHISHMVFFLCAAIYTKHLSAVIDHSPVKRARRSPISSPHQKKE